MGTPVRSLHMFMTVYRESGEAIGNALDGTTADGRPLTATIVIELHARSCQVLYEIVTLIEGGFADGAMSRCRTLHEIAVTAMFLERADEDLAARYINHQVVESWKARPEAREVLRTHCGATAFAKGATKAEISL